MKNINLTPVIVEATEIVKRSAKDFAPVDTGTLRNSIRSRVYNRGKATVVGFVGTPVEYAVYQEFGTRYQAGTPFLRPAMNVNKARIIKSAESFLKNKLRSSATG